jgi:hypothetical protein
LFPFSASFLFTTPLEEVILEVVSLNKVRSRTDSVVVEDQVLIFLFIRRKMMEIFASLLNKEISRVLGDLDGVWAVVNRLIGSSIFSLPSIKRRNQQMRD